MFLLENKIRNIFLHFMVLACVEGFEPPTIRLEVGYSVQLSYTQIITEPRKKGHQGDDWASLVDSALHTRFPCYLDHHSQTVGSFTRA